MEAQIRSRDRARPGRLFGEPAHGSREKIVGWFFVRRNRVLGRNFVSVRILVPRWSPLRRALKPFYDVRNASARQ